MADKLSDERLAEIRASAQTNGFLGVRRVTVLLDEIDRLRRLAKTLVPYIMHQEHCLLWPDGGLDEDDECLCGLDKLQDANPEIFDG